MRIWNLESTANYFGQGLRSLGLNPQDKICIFADTRNHPLWASFCKNTNLVSWIQSQRSETSAEVVSSWFHFLISNPSVNEENFLHFLFHFKFIYPFCKIVFSLLLFMFDFIEQTDLEIAKNCKIILELTQTMSSTLRKVHRVYLQILH